MNEIRVVRCFLGRNDERRLASVDSPPSRSKAAGSASPPTLDLAAGAEGAATVRLLVPADAQPESEATVRLTATSDPNTTAGGFNSAKKTFKIVRE